MTSTVASNIAASTTNRPTTQSHHAHPTTSHAHYFIHITNSAGQPITPKKCTVNHIKHTHAVQSNETRADALTTLRLTMLTPYTSHATRCPLLIDSQAHPTHTSPIQLTTHSCPLRPAPPSRFSPKKPTIFSCHAATRCHYARHPSRTSQQGAYQGGDGSHVARLRKVVER